jgi:hypothetical protein
MPTAFVNQFAQGNAIEMASLAELSELADRLQMVALLWTVNRDQLSNRLPLAGDSYGLAALDAFQNFGQRTGRFNGCHKCLYIPV